MPYKTEQKRQDKILEAMRRAFTLPHSPPIPGMERLGPLPVPGPAPLPRGLAPRPPEPEMGRWDRPLIKPPEIPEPGPEVSMPELLIGGTAEGVSRGLSHLTSPRNLATIGGITAGSLIPGIGALIGGGAGLYFTYEMAKGLIDSIPEAKKAAQEGDWRTLGNIVGQDILMAYFTKKAGQHTVRGAARAIGRVGDVRAAAHMSQRAQQLFDQAAKARSPLEAERMRVQAQTLLRESQRLDPRRLAPVAPPRRTEEPQRAPEDARTQRIEEQIAQQVQQQEEAGRPAQVAQQQAAQQQVAQQQAAVELGLAEQGRVRQADIARQQQPTREAWAEEERIRQEKAQALERASEEAQADMERAVAEIEAEPSGANIVAKEISQIFTRTTAVTPKAPAVPADALSPEAGVLMLPSAQEVKASKQWFLRRTFDEYTPVRDLAEIAPLALEENPYIGARMYAGHFGKVWVKLRELRDIYRPIAKRKMVPQFEEYLELQRDIELFRRADIENYRSPRAANLREAEAKRDAILDGLSPEERALFEQKARDYYKLHDDLRADSADAGIISQEALEEMQRNNQYYTPFHRLAYLAENVDKLEPGGRSFSVGRQGVYHRIEGSEIPTELPLEATIRNIHRIISLNERNRVARQLAALSERDPWVDIVRPRGRNERLAEGEDTFWVFEDGVKSEYIAPKPVAEAIKGMAPRQVNWLEKLITFTNEGVRSGATMYYLPFVVKNIYRDYRTALLRSPVGFTPYDWLLGFARTIRRGEHFVRYMRSGAAQAGFFERPASLRGAAKRITESEARRTMRYLVNPLAFMRLISETIELTPRLGVFERALRAGMSEQQAAWIARNATQDFSRIGTWMRRWNMLTPFVNARLHGTVNVYAGIKQNPARGAAVVGLTSLLPALYLYYHNKLFFPDVLAEIDPDVRDANFLYIYGRKKDEKGNYTQVLKIPRIDMDNYFTKPVEAFLDWMEGANPVSWWEVLGEFISDQSPISFMRRGEFAPDRAAGEAMPPLAAAMWELSRGVESYSGYPIEPERTEGGSAAMRWGTTPGTLELEQSMVGRGLLKLSEKAPILSPLQYRHLIRRLLAGSGRLLTAPVETETIQERAGTLLGREALAHMFVGARGGATTKREARALKPYKREVRDEEILRDRNITRVLEDIRKAPDANPYALLLDRWGEKEKWGDKALDDRGLDRALLKVEAGIVGMTPGELSIMYAPDRAKAKYILDLEEKLPMDEFFAQLDRWQELGFMEDGTWDAIGEVRLEREMAQLDAQGVPRPQPVARPQGDTVADRNNNPLNLRGPDGRFQVFETPEEGWAAGINDLRLKMEGRSRHIQPDAPLSQLFEVWAPAQELGNHPEGYTQYVATRLGVSPDTPIRDLAGRIEELAAAMGDFEGWTGGPPPGMTVQQTQAAGRSFAEAFLRVVGGGR